METKTDSTSLDDKPFSFRQYKSGIISIYWRGQEVTILKGEKAEKFSVELENATEIEAQLMMAKITGNFKRGNERVGKLRGK
jgi:hypothetical protein